MTDSSTVTILIVDDDDAKRYSIARILQKAGFQTREVATGTEALRRIGEGFDLVILDVKLPDLSGFEVCRRIKTDPATCAIPVLHLSTTFVELEDKVQGLEGGADGYLTDVLEPLELIATVRALLRARRAEEAAQISNRQWQSTFDAVNDGVLLLDRDGKVARVNQALERILALTWNDLIGRSCDELLEFPGESGGTPFQRMLATQTREVGELSRGNRWLRVAIDPVRDAQGVIKGALGIVSDVTDHRELEQELRRRAEELATADRRKDEFLAMLAHELRNPLAPILNCLELVRQEAAAGRDLAPTLEIADRQVKHMARLLDDLLDVSRFTQGKIQLQQNDVDFATVVTHAVEMCTPMIESRRHRLALDLPAEPLRLHGDATRLEQVVANLLNNAAKYTEPGGRISLSVRRQRDDVVLRVQDNGIGLAPEMQARVFDLFTQADLSLDRTQGGLGIGLTLVRSLVELHGGRVGVQSPGLGKGSEFTVSLPIVEGVAAQGSRTSVPTATPADGPLQILVVDDHRDSALSLARVLKSWGHRTRVAHDGTAALATFNGEDFEVVFLDIGLPGMDGYEVAAKLRGMKCGRPLVLVALTGYGQNQDLRRSETAGFDRHLVKPVSLETVRDLLLDVRPILDRSRVVSPVAEEG